MFGTDGVRGVANQEPMTVETVMKLGKAIACISKHKDNHPRILVGKDTRISGDMLENALTAGICSAGADAILVGVMPTPGIALLTTDMRCDAGAVISASHNPYEDNGIKFFADSGHKLSEELENAIEQFVKTCNYSARPTPGNGRIGKAIRLSDALGRYIVSVKNSFPKKADLQGFKIILDCANGAAYKAAPMVFDELGADVMTMFDAPDGMNINQECGSLHPEAVGRQVKISGADVGIALDGDADRVIFIDEAGAEVNGDQIMGLIAAHMLQMGTLAKDTLVATVMSNIGLEKAMREIGVSLVRTPVGDKYVVKRMLKEGFNFGGEQSGHIIFLDHNTSGDGIFTALQVIKVMLETGKPLSELASRTIMYPQILTNVVVKSRKNLEEIPQVLGIIKYYEDKLNTQGRLLVRYSGTQLLCRVMAEGENESEVKEAVKAVADAISRYV